MQNRSYTVKNIIGGVSQQPPVLVKPEQLKVQENFLSSEIEGVTKRPSTVFKGFFDTNLTDDCLLHTINRDEDEQYIIIFDNQTIKVIDLNGTEYTVNGALTYLPIDTSKLRVVSVADYTFVLNTSVKPTLTSEVTTYGYIGNPLVHIKSGQYGRTYKVIVNDTQVASYTTPTGSTASDVTALDVNNIRDQLCTQILANLSGSSVEKGDGWFVIKDVTVNTIVTADGFNGQALIAIPNSAQRFNVLPSTAPDGYYCEIQLDPEDGGNPYYVKYNDESKVWVECTKTGLNNHIDPVTMPHALVREADNTFTFKALDWIPRKAGDEDTNSNPTFINNYIKDIFFFKNSLGLLAGENTILSERGEFFNFWLKTATDVLDVDSIDIPCSSNRINILNFGVPFNNELIVFSNDSQFVLDASGGLSPKTASLSPATSFSSSPTIKPIVSGKNIYFTVERDMYTTVREYYVIQDVSDIKNSNDITAHAPNYIPSNVKMLESSTTNNMITLVSSNEPNTIYLYKYLYQNEQKVMNSWSKFKFPYKVLDISFIGNLLYIVFHTQNGLSITTMDFTYEVQDLPEDTYKTLVDLKKAFTFNLSHYDDAFDKTTVLLSSIYGTTLNVPNGELLVIDSDGLVKEVDIIDGYLTLQGNWIDKTIIIGLKIHSKLTLHEVLLRKADGQGGYMTESEGVLKLRHLHFYFTDSYNMKAEVAIKGTSTKYEYYMTGKTLGAYILKDFKGINGTFVVPVRADTKKVEISIVSDYPTSCSIVGYTFMGNLIKRSRSL